MEEAAEFHCGAHATISGLGSKPEFNDEHCVSLGLNPDNQERVLVVLRSGMRLSLRPSNLKPAELLPGSNVVIVGLTNAAQYNGKCGEVVSWQGERWIVDLESKERKSFRSENLVIMPERVASKKRPADAPEPEAKKIEDDRHQGL